LVPFVAGAVLAGPALDDDQLRLGGRVQAGVFALGVLGAFVGVGYERTATKGAFSARWMNAHLGALMRPTLPLGPVFIEIWGAVGLRQVTGTYEHEGEVRSTSLLDPLFLGGVDVGLAWTESWETWLGVGLMSNDRATRFFVDQAFVAREPSVTGFLELGLRGRFVE
jgi:hypothetical protein